MYACRQDPARCGDPRCWNMRVTEISFTSDRETAAHAGASALVTGGAGFIGSRLCDLLRASGWVVHSVSRRAAGPPDPPPHRQPGLTEAAGTPDLLTSLPASHVFRFGT